MVHLVAILAETCGVLHFPPGPRFISRSGCATSACLVASIGPQRRNLCVLSDFRTIRVCTTCANANAFNPGMLYCMLTCFLCAFSQCNRQAINKYCTFDHRLLSEMSTLVPFRALCQVNRSPRHRH